MKIRTAGNIIKITALSAGLLLVLLATVNFNSDVRSQNSDMGVSNHTLTDMSMESVRIKQNPQKIISLAPSVTEILFALGLGERIIGITSGSNYPPQAEKIEKVGDLLLNYEKIVSKTPDLVIIDISLRPRDTEKLRKLNLPILCVSSDNYRNFIYSVELIGKATGTDENAHSILSDMNDKMNMIARCIRSVEQEQRPKVFVEVWNSPLMTAGGDTFIHYVIENAGGINITSDMKGYPQLNPEVLLIRNPDVIILTTSDKDEFISNSNWKNLDAVRNHRVYSIDPDILARPTPRLFEGCRTLYNIFYPDRTMTSN